MQKQNMKQKLEQYAAAKIEMGLIDVELHRFHTVTDSVRGSMTEYPYLTRRVAIEGVDLSVSGLLYAKRERLAGLRREVEQFLAEVEDSYVASLIRLRYVEGLKWEEVADKMNEHGAQYTGSGLRSTLHRFLKSLEAEGSGA